MLAEVPDAPDLKGPCWLRCLQLEVNGGTSHFAQGNAVPHWSGRMEGRLGGHLTAKKKTRRQTFFNPRKNVQILQNMNKLIPHQNGLFPVCLLMIH